MTDGAPGGRNPLDWSLFTHPAAFQCITVVRSFCSAVLCGGVFFAAVLWFEVTFNHVSGASAKIAGAVTILFLVGLRVDGGRRFTLLSGESGAVGRRFARRAAPYAVVLLLAAGAVANCPGGLLARWLPFGVAVLLPWRLRKMARSFLAQQAWRPTLAGFRPSWRAVFSWPGFPALMNLDAALPPGAILSATTNITDTEPDKSTRLFLRQGDYRSAAYCEARTVEYLLARSRISDAETRIRAGLEDKRLSREPAFMAAQAEFLVAVGDHDQALGLLQEARTRSARPPVQLETRLLAAVVDTWRQPGSKKPAWSEWRRARLVWNRQPGAVLLGLAADAWLMSASDGDSAQKLAYQVCRLPDRLIAMPAGDFDLHDYEQGCMAKGLALETAAQVYEQRGQHFEAATAFLEAYEAYGLIRDRRRGGRCVVLGFVNALTAGYDGPEEEGHGLDMIRVGLQIVEDDRGTLRGEESRASWIASQRAIYAATFRQLTRIRFHQARAAELGLWLLESLHRSLTAGLLVQHGAIDADSGLLAAMAELTAAESEPGRDDLAELRANVRSRLGNVREAATVVSGATDTESVLARLGGRTAILYHCWRNDDGWTLHSVLVSARHGLDVHRGYIPAPPVGVSSWLTAAGALNAIAAGDEATMCRIFQGVPVGDKDFRLWEDIAQALFPGSWRDILCTRPGAGNPELLIVPDGPIAGLPLGALPDRNGKPLLESVPIALVPALSMLSLPGEQPQHPRRSQRIAVVHLDDRHGSGPSGTTREAQRWLAVSHRMRVIETDSQASIAEALQGPERPDVIAISAHGVRERGQGTTEHTAFSAHVRLRDGTVLSEESALRFTWPPVVILASCSVGAASSGTGLEPSGFPLSCLLRGARTVIGGVAPIPDSQTTDVMCRIIDNLPDAADTLALLQGAQAAVLSDKQASGIVTAVEVAGLTAWTTATASQAGGQAAPPTHWDRRGLPRSETASSGTRTTDEDLSEASRVVLAHASHLAKGQAVGTLEFLAAAFTADSANWAGFAVACETGEPVLPGPKDESADGTLTTDFGQSKVTITRPLAVALQRGRTAARLMHDDTTLPAHVILAAFLDDTTAAGLWIRHAPEPAAVNWAQYLSDRIFQADLPEPRAILNSQKSGSAETHTDNIPEPPAQRQHSLWWLIPAGILAILAMLPATQSLANHMQAQEDSASWPGKIPYGLAVTFLGIILATGKIAFLMFCGIALLALIVIVRRRRRPGDRNQQRRT